MNTICIEFFRYIWNTRPYAHLRIQHNTGGRRVVKKKYYNWFFLKSFRIRILYEWVVNTPRGGKVEFVRRSGVYGAEVAAGKTLREFRQNE